MKDEYRAFLMSQTYATLFSVMNKIRTICDQSIGELTSRQLMALIAILHLPEDEATLKGVSSKLGTTKQSTAQLIENLKKRGFLETTPSGLDGRSVIIKITDMAKPIFEESNKKGWEFFDILFHEFSTQELAYFGKCSKSSIDLTVKTKTTLKRRGEQYNEVYKQSQNRHILFCYDLPNRDSVFCTNVDLTQFSNWSLLVVTCNHCTTDDCNYRQETRINKFHKRFIASQHKNYLVCIIDSSTRYYCYNYRLHW